MNIKTAIRRAAELSYDEDANQIVGKIDGKWAIAHTEDMGLIASMDDKTTFRVESWGANASDFMTAMERMGIEGDQDWDNESTTFDVDGDIITVSGPTVFFEDHQEPEKMP